MATKVTGLGRGLDFLIRETSSSVENSDTPSVLPLASIVPNPNQPRKHFEKEALDELAASIASQGVLQPLLVRPMAGEHEGKYEIVAGERRWRASQLAELDEVPVVIRSFSEQEVLLAALIENLQREDLNPIEEALGVETLRNEFSLSQEELAQQLGKSRSAIANSLRLLTLPLDMQTEVATGALSAGHARALLGIDSEAACRELRDAILEQRLSVREAEGLASRWKATGSFEDAPAENSFGQGSEILSGISGQATGQVTGQVLEQGLGQASVRNATGRKQPSSEKLLAAQQHLSETLSVPVKVTGTESKGKISISFSSKEELEALVALLGRFS